MTPVDVEPEPEDNSTPEEPEPEGEGSDDELEPEDNGIDDDDMETWEEYYTCNDCDTTFTIHDVPALLAELNHVLCPICQSDQLIDSNTDEGDLFERRQEFEQSLENLRNPDAMPGVNDDDTA